MIRYIHNRMEKSSTLWRSQQRTLDFLLFFEVEFLPCNHVIYLLCALLCSSISLSIFAEIYTALLPPWTRMFLLAHLSTVSVLNYTHDNLSRKLLPSKHTATDSSLNMASNTSLSPGDNSSPRCRLLELPREIRDRIYKYAVRCRRAIHKHHDQTVRRVIEDSRVPLPGSLCNLLLANRQIYKEATECLYRCNWIRFAPNPLFFRPPFQLLYAMRQHLDIPSEHFSLLTNVTVTGVYSDPEAFPDVPFTASFSHFLKHVAPELESLRRLCLLVPTAMVSSRVHCMCEVMSEAACRCRMAFTVTEERYRTLYDQLQNLEHHNMSRDRSPLQFRFMAGSSNTSESVAPIPYPDRCPQINIGPDRVFEVYDLLMFAHLLLQLERHLSCTECDETDYGYMERRFFDFKLVEKQPAESQDMVLKHDHCPGWDKVRKRKNYSERIEKMLEKYCDIVKEIRAERQGSNS